MSDQQAGSNQQVTTRPGDLYGPCPDCEIEDPAHRDLVATDTCDRCGARAYVRVTIKGGLELLYCVHDFRPVNLANLAAVGGVVHDDRQQLNNEVKKTEA